MADGGRGSSGRWRGLHEVMEAGGVNPSAMDYTELDRLPVRPARLDRRIVLWP